MKTETSGFDIQRILDIAWRHKWVILIPFVIVFVSTALWGLYLPNLYRSSASIFVEPQEVPRAYVESTITTDLEARARAVTNQLKSRTMLLGVINDIQLYPDEVAKGVPPEQLVGKMNRNLEVEVQAGRDISYFYVHFIHENPAKAMAAVSTLISRFIEESLQDREQQAEGTTLFIEEELEKLKKVLEEQEAAIQSFKRRHIGELPDQLDANLRMLDNLQLQLTNNLTTQREVEDRKMFLEREISRLEGGVVRTGPAGEGSEGTRVLDGSLDQLIGQRAALQQSIADMEVRYTENHPDLITARRELSRIEERLQARARDIEEDREGGSSTVVPQSPAASTELSNLRRQLNEISPRLPALKKEEQNILAKIADYRRKVETAPGLEQQLLKLTRDYQNTQASYEQLLNKRIQAQLSENLEKRQKGEKFQVLDPPSLPISPYLPDRKRIIGVGFFAGLAVGVALAFLLETVFGGYTSTDPIQARFQAPIIIGMPYLSSKAEKRKKLALGFGSAFALLLLSGAALFYIDQKVVSLGQFMSTIVANFRGML